MVGRREGSDRRRELARLSAGFSDGAAIWIVSVVVDPLASGIPERASERYRINKLRAAFDFAAAGIFRDGRSAPVGRRQDDRDRPAERSSPDDPGLA
ncbi:protein of unknown function (plasmid) [Shinella sp. WSC3-e]|nr:hypothetical protein SHINE37_100060 [Rhizobiaceae bacterium]CAK7261600.1 protein of unknown function [Shinella sp. WSC3-e]